MKTAHTPIPHAHSSLATRTDIVNPCARTSFWERAAKAGAVDLRGNQKTVVLASGFVDVVPIDAKKIFLGKGRHPHSQS